ncbi:MAG: bifunctional chorismate mutase/prephenate dehydrogenase [Verrucomicrobiota bacterium]|jgi:chorismate mutase/prephenate dehydrogenase
MTDALESQASALPLTGTSAQEIAVCLDGLRREVDAIDEQIVRLLAERHARVQNVVALKTACKLPIYHPAREENLISQRRAQAQQAGLDPDHIEELYRSILRQSRVRQTVQTARRGVRPGAKVLIVGGRGKMGRYFGRWFNESGYAVRILEVDDWPRVQALCDGLALALISVPIEVTPAVIAQVGPHLPHGCVLADLTSLKHAAVEAMLAAHAGPVVGLHPLFGPSTSSMDKQLMVMAPGRLSEECQWLIDQMMAWGNVVLPISAREHDDIMNIVQGVRHFATFSFGQFLWRRNIDLARTLEFSSPIYRLELGMVGRLFAQDASLYANIIFASPERRALLKDFVHFVAENESLLEEGNREKFGAEFRQIADWFGPFCEQAMRESTFLIDKLVERF